MDLFQCARENQVQELERLLASGNININEMNTNGYTALHVAIFHGHEACVRILLENGANVNTYNSVQRTTPLLSALNDGNTNIIKMILDHGCDFNTCIYHNHSPLHLAVNYNNVSIIEQLLLHGADPNAKNEFDETPLYTAIDYNRSNDIIELLLNHGADPNHLPKDIVMSDTIKQLIEDYFADPIKEPGSY